MLLAIAVTFLTECDVPFVNAMKLPTAKSVLNVLPVPVTVSLVELNETLPVMLALLSYTHTRSP